MSVEWRKYGTQTTIYFPLIKASSQNFAVSGDYTHASGDVKISKDGGAAATATNSPSAITMGNGAMWSLTLTATEMQAAEIVVTIIDAATKAVEDQMIKLHTFGHTSAKIVADLSAANLAANVTQFGGTNGTFASGRPEVNSTHWGGTAVASATVAANATQWGGVAVTGMPMPTYTQPTGFLAATFPATVASPTNITAGTITTVTNLTNAPPDSSGTTSLLTRLSATRAGYLDNLSGGAVMLASSYAAPPSAAAIATQVDTTLSGTHGAGSWATATGFSTLDAAGVRAAVGLAAANLDTQLDALPTASEAAAQVAAIDIDGKTLQAAFRIICAAAAGLASGAGTSSETYKGLDQSTTRLVVVADASGNRTSVTYS